MKIAATGSCSIYSDSSGRSSSNSSSSTADGEASCNTRTGNACEVTRLKCLADGLACPLLVVVTTPFMMSEAVVQETGFPGLRECKGSRSVRSVQSSHKESYLFGMGPWEPELALLLPLFRSLLHSRAYVVLTHRQLCRHVIIGSQALSLV